LSDKVHLNFLRLHLFIFGAKMGKITIFTKKRHIISATNSSLSRVLLATRAWGKQLPFPSPPPSDIPSASGHSLGSLVL